MRLAEALLRVPDSATAIALTADQLGRASFDGNSDGAHSSALGRCQIRSSRCRRRRCQKEDPARHRSATRPVRRSVPKPWLPPRCAPMQLLARQFVLGQTIEDALGEAKSQRRSEPHLRFSFDMLGEGARTMDDADRYFASYQHAIRMLAQAYAAHGRRTG